MRVHFVSFLLVEGLGLRNQDRCFRAWGSGSWDQSLGPYGSRLKLQILDSGFRFEGLGFRRFVALWLRIDHAQLLEFYGSRNSGSGSGFGMKV